MLNDICDDDNIMEFLTIHDEVDDFTKALNIITNNLEDDTDDGNNFILFLPPFVWVVVLVLEKLPTSSIVMSLLASSFR